MKKLTIDKPVSSDLIHCIVGIEFILCLCIVIFTMVGIKSFVSVCFYSTFVFEYALLFLVMLQKRESNYKLLFILGIITILSLSNVFINGIDNGMNTIPFDYLKKCLMFLSSLIWFYLATQIKVKKKFITVFVIAIAFSLFLYCLAYFFVKERMFLFRGRMSDYLTFGFENPNLAGLFLVVLFFYTLVAFNINKNIFFKILCIVLMVFCSFFVYKTHSRNSLIALVITLFVAFVWIVRKKKHEFSKMMLFVSVISPLLFLMIYMSFIETPFMQNTFQFLVTAEKGFDSRLLEWTNCLAFFKTNPLFGAYYEISNGTGVSQCLNSCLDVLSSYGVIVFLLFVAFLYMVLKKVNHYMSFVGFAAFCGFLACIYAGIGEAAFFSGGTGISILAGGFILLTNSFRTEENTLI